MTDTGSNKGQSSLTTAAQEVLARELPEIEASLKRVLAALDTRVEPCCACGLKVARSYNDLRADETFRGTLRKVQAYMERV